jgi:predicted dehydrogenase
LNLAIIGLGNWGKKLLIEFNKSNTIKFCYTKGNTSNLNWLKKNFPKIYVTNKITEILDADIDGVIIATPIDSHKELVEKFLLHGKHVFVEKPLSKTISESKKLIALAKKKKLCLFVGNIFLYHPIFFRLQKLLASEKIKSISGTWLKTGTFNDDILLNLLYHDICIVHSLIGKPNKLKILNSQKLVTKSDIVDVQMIYSNNTTCNFHINRISNIKQKSITLITEKNCYLWENNTLFKFSKKNNTFKKFYESKNTALENECKSFSKEISGQIKSNNAQISLEIMKDLCTIL